MSMIAEAIYVMWRNGTYTTHVIYYDENNRPEQGLVGGAIIVYGGIVAGVPVYKEI